MPTITTIQGRRKSGTLVRVHETGDISGEAIDRVAPLGIGSRKVCRSWGVYDWGVAFASNSQSEIQRRQLRLASELIRLATGRHPSDEIAERFASSVVSNLDRDEWDMSLESLKHSLARVLAEMDVAEETTITKGSEA